MTASNDPGRSLVDELIEERREEQARENASAAAGRKLLDRVAKQECVYVTGGQPPECPKEWPRTPKEWCGACLARTAISRGL